MTAHPIDIIVGRNIRKYRKRLGMSLEVLATEIGVSYQQLQKYETAVNRVSASRLYVTSRTLKVKLNDLYWARGRHTT